MNVQDNPVIKQEKRKEKGEGVQSIKSVIKAGNRRSRKVNYGKLLYGEIPKPEMQIIH